MAGSDPVLWDGKTASNNKASAGTYLYVITDGKKVIKKDKLFIIRK